MLNKIVLLGLVVWFAGCAAPRKPLILINQPNWSMQRFPINHGSVADRLELARLECRMLDETLEAFLITTDVEKIYLKDQSDYFLCRKLSQKNVTPLELRVLQSRLFKTTASNLIGAINTFVRDVGGDCQNKSQLKLGSFSGIIDKDFGIEVNEIECRALGKQFNIEFNQIPSGVLMRTRIYAPDSVNRQIQITDPREYADFFKQIADQLFIEAIEINPAEMR